MLDESLQTERLTSVAHCGHPRCGPPVDARLDDLGFAVLSAEESPSFVACVAKPAVVLEVAFHNGTVEWGVRSQ